MRRGRAPSPARGFTLVELLVVSTLMLLLAMLTASMWTYFSAQATELGDRTRAAAELRMALSAVSDDMGSVVWASPMGTSLVLCRLGPPGQEPLIVQYSVENGLLVRTEQVSGLAVPLAGHVGSISAENVTDSLMRVVLTVSCGKTQRQSTLYWSRA